MAERTQGNRANTSGNTLESTVIAVFKAKGFSVVSHKEWKKNPGKYGQELLLTNAPYETIYNHKGKTEFLLKSQEKQREVRIECKWQQSAGSVDEKFPYLYLNCIETMLESEIIILVDGGGYKAGALTWLKEAVAGKKYQSGKQHKEIKVFSLTEFLIWANATF